MGMKPNAQVSDRCWIIRSETKPNAGYFVFRGKERYDTQEEAIADAERIAEERPSEKIYVFESIGFAQKIVPATFTWVTE